MALAWPPRFSLPQLEQRWCPSLSVMVCALAQLLANPVLEACDPQCGDLLAQHPGLLLQAPQQSASALNKTPWAELAVASAPGLEQEAGLEMGHA